MRKYLGIILNINKFNYYIPLTSPKKSDYKNNAIRKSVIPIIRIVSDEEVDNIHDAIVTYNFNIYNYQSTGDVLPAIASNITI